MDAATIITLVIFIATYALIISEKVHRTTAAMAGAVSMVIVGLNYQYLSNNKSSITENNIIEFVDFNTIGLLLGMMIIIAVLQDTGFFEYLGHKFLKASKGNLWKMLVIFSTVTAFMSMFLDNTTTILLMVPLTITIADKIDVNPIPLVITESIFSNIGGIATLIGDPPNVMIGSASGLSFNQFLIHLFPISLVVMGATLILARFMFRKFLAQDIKDNEKLVEGNGEKESFIKDPIVLYEALAVLLITITLFALHDVIGLMPSVVALIGASIVLLITRADPGKVLEKVEWTSLMFFAASVINPRDQSEGVIDLTAHFLDIRRLFMVVFIAMRKVALPTVSFAFVLLFRMMPMFFVLKIRFWLKLVIFWIRSMRSMQPLGLRMSMSS